MLKYSVNVHSPVRFTNQISGNSLNLYFYQIFEKSLGWFETDFGVNWLIKNNQLIIKEKKKNFERLFLAFFFFVGDERSSDWIKALVENIIARASIDWQLCGRGIGGGGGQVVNEVIYRRPGFDLPIGMIVALYPKRVERPHARSRKD